MKLADSWGAGLESRQSESANDRMNGVPGPPSPASPNAPLVQFVGNLPRCGTLSPALSSQIGRLIKGRCVFPGNTEELECWAGAGRMDVQPHPEVDVNLEVPYRGFHPDVRYETKIGVTGRFDEWRGLYEDVT